MGVLAVASDDRLRLRAAVALGGRMELVDVSGIAAAADELGVSAAERLLERLALPTLRGIAWTPEDPEEVTAP